MSNSNMLDLKLPETFGQERIREKMNTMIVKTVFLESLVAFEEHNTRTCSVCRAHCECPIAMLLADTIVEAGARVMHTRFDT